MKFDEKVIKKMIEGVDFDDNDMKEILLLMCKNSRTCDHDCIMYKFSTNYSSDSNCPFEGDGTKMLSFLKKEFSSSLPKNKKEIISLDIIEKMIKSNDFSNNELEEILLNLCNNTSQCDEDCIMYDVGSFAPEECPLFKNGKKMLSFLKKEFSILPSKKDKILQQSNKDIDNNVMDEKFMVVTSEDSLLYDNYVDALRAAKELVKVKEYTIPPNVIIMKSIYAFTFTHPILKEIKISNDKERTKNVS